MKLNHLMNRLSSTPVIIRNNKESLLCLNSNLFLVEGEEMICKLDDSDYNFEFQNIAIINETTKCRQRFPSISIREPFWEFDFNEQLFTNFEFAKKLFLTQSDIKNQIVKVTKKNKLVVLIIIDGLSYMDCRYWRNVIPCLVDTVSNTTCGFNNIIGSSNSIAYQLFKKEISNFVGFSYWDRTNELTGELFKNISPLHKIERFSDILEKIEKIELNNTYLQIVLNGLDGIAHKNWDEPLIIPIVEKLYKKINHIYEILQKFGVKGDFFVTSDHGILWKHQQDLVKISQDDVHKTYNVRYYPTKLMGPRTINFHSCGKNYSSIKFPFITRKLRANEWGVHGGLSLAESITPFLHWKIN